MRVIIDTSSLLSLVRYYLPFDNNGVLFEFIKNKILNNEIFIIDEVMVESGFNSKGIILKELEYLTDTSFKKTSKQPINTEFLPAPAPSKFINQVDNSFINASIRNKLTDEQYDSRRKTFLQSADARMIIYALNRKHNDSSERCVIVTEETEGSNDQKEFKKIPAICKILNIECMTLPSLIEQYKGQINLVIN